MSAAFSDLWKAADRGKLEDVRNLLGSSQGATDVNLSNPNKCGNTPLYVAAQNGHLAVAELLLLNGANVDQGTTDGSSTPLSKASYKAI